MCGRKNRYFYVIFCDKEKAFRARGVRVWTDRVYGDLEVTLPVDLQELQCARDTHAKRTLRSRLWNFTTLNERLIFRGN